MRSWILLSVIGACLVGCGSGDSVSGSDSMEGQLKEAQKAAGSEPPVPKGGKMTKVGEGTVANVEPASN